MLCTTLYSIDSQLAILSEQVLSKLPTELHYVERSVFMKEVITQNLWSFELGTQEARNIPVWIIVGFQHREGEDLQNLKDDILIELQ